MKFLSRIQVKLVIVELLQVECQKIKAGNIKACEWRGKLKKPDMSLSISGLLVIKR